VQNRLTRIPAACAGSGTIANVGGGWFFGPNYSGALFCEIVRPSEVAGGNVTVGITYQLSSSPGLTYQFNTFATPHRLGVSRPPSVNANVASSVFSSSVFLRTTVTFASVDFFPAGTFGTELQIVPFTPPQGPSPDMVIVAIDVEYLDER
jgi:hypothetical protein